ncbi:Retrovirus-related Pol polyprotein from transposon 412 [Formica fusca]
MFTYNTTPHTATGFTPFELIYGHRATLLTTLSQPPKPTYTYDDYAQELKEKLRASQQIAKKHIKNEKIKTKENYDKKTKEIKLKVGEKALLYDETVRRGRSKKLDSLWTGPYTIIEKNSEVNYTIKRGRKTIRVHINRLKPFIEN